MNWKQIAESWLAFDQLDEELRTELEQIKHDDQAMQDAFYEPLKFGTGGIRGVLGAGINRMNIYTVRKAAKGLALYLERYGSDFKKHGVVVAYDSRYKSKEFAIETARVLGVHGIKTYVFTSLRPTPELSFAVRHLGTAAGVMITASHNPPEYNGYKVYNETGGQLPPEQADLMIEKVNGIENELTIEVMDQEALEEQGLLQWIDEDVDKAYLSELKSITLNADVISKQADELNIVFTPLHGTAGKLVTQGLKQLGFNQVHLVEEQMIADPEFSTVESPNPEEHQAFEYAIGLGEKVDADILVATDPDADRLGVAAKNAAGNYQVLSGNQLGALMLDYILANTKEIPSNGMMIKTIVTSELGRAVAEHYGIQSMDVLTGFKFISEKIEEFQQTSTHTFMFGYEESYGYLINDFSRDKDAVQSTMMACEMAAFYNEKGMTLFDALETLYEQHGYYIEDLHSVKMEGIDGAKEIARLMDRFRENPVNTAGDLNAEIVEDYTTGRRTYLADGREEEIELPSANVLKVKMSDDCWYCLRPSGTEPKMKFYFGVKGETREEADRRLEQLKKAILENM
ncbi:phospho-sugar mutase [Allobacillus sp. GCM10007491]|uniref:Phosphoglucomutase n=1 Tax=Allobacillus saliphilus TaxID=2912308 RepID=A0A941CUC9_9BACI|nr:phospho-sugar mutase [Allobacillus saliphilus]MBR7552558.1 phospho-sugar mutase [Allobacillus saliphilus]